MDQFKKTLLIRWVGANLLGWIIGTALTTVVSMGIIKASLLFGAVIGMMQLLILRHWKVRPIRWVAATSFAWGISALLIYRYYNGASGLLFYPLRIMLTGACAGACQTWAVGKYFPARASWIWANIIGYLVSSIMYIVLVVPASMILLLSYETGQGGSTRGDVYSHYLNVAGFSLAGAISSYATGKLLLKHADHLEDAWKSNSAPTLSD